MGLHQSSWRVWCGPRAGTSTWLMCPINHGTALELAQDSCVVLELGLPVGCLRVSTQKLHWDLELVLVQLWGWHHQSTPRPYRFTRNPAFYLVVQGEPAWSWSRTPPAPASTAQFEPDAQFQMCAPCHACVAQAQLLVWMIRSYHTFKWTSISGLADHTTSHFTGRKVFPFIKTAQLKYTSLTSPVLAMFKTSKFLEPNHAPKGNLYSQNRNRGFIQNSHLKKTV